MQKGFNRLESVASVSTTPGTTGSTNPPSVTSKGSFNRELSTHGAPPSIASASSFKSSRQFKKSNSICSIKSTKPPKEAPSRSASNPIEFVGFPSDLESESEDEDYELIDELEQITEAATEHIENGNFEDAIINLEEAIDLREQIKNMKIALRDPSRARASRVFYMCPGYESYLHQRHNILGKECEVKVKKYKPVWKKLADAIIADLFEMFTSQKHRDRGQQVPIIHGMYHIGSTSVVDLAGKPIIDLMLMLKPHVDFDSAVVKLKNNIVFHREKYPFKIGFTGKSHIDGSNWAMLQIPKEATRNIRFRDLGYLPQINLHIFDYGSKEAMNKLLFRDFLSSAEGTMIRQEYAEKKISLAKQIETGELDAKFYNRKKNAIVSTVLKLAKMWGDEKPGWDAVYLQGAKKTGGKNRNYKF